MSGRGAHSANTSTSTSSGTAQAPLAWRAITAVLTGAIPPELGYDPESGFPARRDDPGNARGRWRWISYQPGPALTAAQVNDLLPYQPAAAPVSAPVSGPGEVTDAPLALPLLAVDPVTGLAAIHTAKQWWWLHYTAAAPLHPAQVADLVLYQVTGGTR